VSLYLSVFFLIVGREELTDQMLKFLGYHTNIFIIIYFSTGVHSRIAYISLEPNKQKKSERLVVAGVPTLGKQSGLVVEWLLYCAAAGDRYGKVRVCYSDQPLIGSQF